MCTHACVCVRVCGCVRVWTLSCVSEREKDGEKCETPDYPRCKEKKSRPRFLFHSHRFSRQDADRGALTSPLTSRLYLALQAGIALPSTRCLTPSCQNAPVADSRVFYLPGHKIVLMERAGLHRHHRLQPSPHFCLFVNKP